MIIDGKTYTLLATNEVIANQYHEACRDYMVNGPRNAEYVLRVWTNGKAELLKMTMSPRWVKVTNWTLAN